jgi:subtilase family serine protease
MTTQENLDLCRREEKKEKLMVRRLLTLSLTFVVSMTFLNVVCQAESRLLTRHMRDTVSYGEARQVGHLPATQTMRLVLALPLRNEANLDSFLEDVYDPTSASYRQFLTVEEFTARFGPTQEDYDAVIRFARENGFAVVGTSRNRVNIDVQGSVATIEKAFHISMGIYQHPTENRTFFAPDREPTTSLAFPLWHISGLDNYSIPHSALRRRDDNNKPHSLATTGSCPGQSFCGSDMRAAYYGGTALTGKGQSVGLLEYVGTDLADLTTYYTNAKQTNNVPITLKSVDGTPTQCLASQGCDDTEQTLDMTQALGMAPGLASLVMYIGSTDAALFNGMATASPLNFNLSSSWYWRPADPNTDDPYFKEFASQGQTLFEAAGDNRSWQIGGSIWPSDDAYVVSVGGTDLTTTGPGGAWKSETAWSDSGGGSWQKKAASGCASCSQTLRNGPDVSANSNFTFYVCADQTNCTANLYGGTSFAAPMWAGWLALVNQMEASLGHKSVGFINPALYSLGLSAKYNTDLNDITVGSNGYSATKGYDLVTGWGSPKAGGFIK